MCKALNALTCLAELGLLQKPTLQELVLEIVPFLCHPVSANNNVAYILRQFSISVESHSGPHEFKFAWTSLCNWSRNLAPPSLCIQSDALKLKPTAIWSLALFRAWLRSVTCFFSWFSLAACDILLWFDWTSPLLSFWIQNSHWKCALSRIRDKRHWGDVLVFLNRTCGFVTGQSDLWLQWLVLST